MSQYSASARFDSSSRRSVLPGSASRPGEAGSGFLDVVSALQRLAEIQVDQITVWWLNQRQLHTRGCMLEDHTAAGLVQVLSVEMCSI